MVLFLGEYVVVAGDDNVQTSVISLDEVARHDCLEAVVKMPLRRLGERLGAARAKSLTLGQDVTAEEFGALRSDLDRILLRLDEIFGDEQEVGPAVIELVNMPSLLSEVQGVARLMFAQAGCPLHVSSFGMAGVQPHSDSLKLRRVLFDLIEHAFARQQGRGVAVDVAVSGPSLVLSAEENGPCIPDDALAALVAGRSADPVLMRLHETAAALGGRLEGVNLSCGFRLSVVVPVDLRAVSSSARGEGARNAATVLLVDVDTAVHELLGEALGGDAYRLIHAFDAQQGFDLAAELMPDVIVLNVLCPGFDGWGLLSRLKNSEAVRHIPVVLLTLADEEEAGFLLRASDYITKPFRFELLLETVNRYRPLEGAPQALVIEDDDVTRTILCRLLERDGWAVAGIANGLDGLQRIGQARPAMVLLDLMMPGMDGFEFLKVMRMTERPGDHIPVVVVTAKDLTDDERDWLSGTTRTIVARESVSRTQLLQVVRDWVSHATSRGTVVV